MAQTSNRKIAVYGKGGIGKSTVSSNLTAALSDLGLRVLQIGCDPKHDSTRSLISGACQTTVLDYLKETAPENRYLDDIMLPGYKGCDCVEAGGPEPGVGCAGRGIISAFDLLSALGADEVEHDITVYDVLGDVVCGGFAVPLRKDYADTVYIVTSGEFMSLYAANNILRGTSNYDPGRIGGIIFNCRGDPDEEERVKAFSEAVDIPVICRIPRSPLFFEAEKTGKTVVEMFPDSDITHIFRDLAHTVQEGKRYVARYLSESELEKLILGRITDAKRRPVISDRVSEPKVSAPYSKGNLTYDAPIHGCAFSGASSVCTSVEGLTTVLHSPRSCAHFTVQLDANCIKGAYARGYSTHDTFADPDVICTDMTENDMVFGGTASLRSKILELISSGKKDIAIITACPPGIIGDDTISVAGSFESEHPDVKIAVLDECGNATGDFMQGVIDAGLALIQKYALKIKTEPMTVDLVGVKTMSSSAVSELEQVKSVLSEMGIKVNCVLPGFCDLAQLKNCGNAAVSLKLNHDGFSGKIGTFLKDTFGIPVLDIPVRGGLSGLSAWVRCIAEFFNVQDKAEKVISEYSHRYTELMQGPRNLLKGKTCCIMTVGDDVDWILETIDRCGMVLQKAIIVRRSDYNRDLSDMKFKDPVEVIDEQDLPKKLAEINDLKPDVLLTPATADVDPSIYQSRLPCAPSTDPFAGRLLAEDWIRGTLAPKEEGWRKDVA